MSDTVSAAPRRTGGVLAGVLACSLAALVACSSDDTDTTEQQDSGPDLTAAPENVSWTAIGTDTGVKVPKADEGPESVGTYGEASGFDQSPVGAGLAAMNGPLRVSFAPEDQWQNAVSAALAPGEARDELLTNRASVEATGEVDDEFVPTLQGWTIADDYTDEAATVDVYASYSDESLAKTTYELVWLADDWKIQLPGDVTSVDDLPDDLVEVAE